MIHQLKEMSELAGASMATVKLALQLPDCRSLIVDRRWSQVFFDLTKSTLLSVLVVGVKYTRELGVT